MTLNAYLDGWRKLLRTRVQPTTHRSYDDMIHSYLRPLLGECLVGELTVPQCNLHFVHLLQQGGRRGGPLTPKTVHYAHAILRQALGEAVRDGLLADNVAERAARSSSPPRPAVTGCWRSMRTPPRHWPASRHLGTSSGPWCSPATTGCRGARR